MSENGKIYTAGKNFVIVIFQILFPEDAKSPVALVDRAGEQPRELCGARQVGREDRVQQPRLGDGGRRHSRLGDLRLVHLRPAQCGRSLWQGAVTFLNSD